MIRSSDLGGGGGLIGKRFHGRARSRNMEIWIQGHNPNHLGHSIVIRGALSMTRSLSSASGNGNHVKIELK